MVKVFPVGLRQRIYRLIPPPVRFSLEGVPLQRDLSKFPIFHLNLFTELSKLLLVVINLVHKLGLLELILVQGTGHLFHLSVPLSENLVHVVVFFLKFLDELGESFSLLFFRLELFCELLVHDGESCGLFALLLIFFELLSFFIFEVLKAVTHSLIFTFYLLVAHEDERELVL